MKKQERRFAWFTTECPNINERMVNKTNKKKRKEEVKEEAPIKRGWRHKEFKWCFCS